MRIRDLLAADVSRDLPPVAPPAHEQSPGTFASEAHDLRRMIHERFLRKLSAREPELRELFRRHRSDLRLQAFGCEEIGEEEFLEVYPLLPAQVDLLLQIVSSLRGGEARAPGEEHAESGLLQLLGGLFREQKLGDREVGDLVTLDTICELQQSSLDADVRATLGRIVEVGRGAAFAVTSPQADARDDALAVRAAKAVALLELIQDQRPTTVEVVAQCLYARLGQGSQVAAVSEVLDRLRGASLVTYSAERGYRIQSSAGQEWQRERDELSVTQEQISELVRERVKELVAMPESARFKGRSFPWSAWYSDEKQANDMRLLDARDDASVTVDFRFLPTKEERTITDWIRRSDQDIRRDTIVWVVGEPGRIAPLARELGRSRHMVRRYEPRKGSLPRERHRLLVEELARSEDLEVRLRDCIAEAFLDGNVYFRARTLRPQEFAAAFGPALTAIATRFLPELYPHFTDVTVTDAELNELLEPTLSSPSTKFLEAGLGILSFDAGKYVPVCVGAEPARVLQFITESGGASGATVIARFGRPPYGYPADVVRACLAGLLRAGKIRIRPEEGPELTAIKDPGVKYLFRRDRDLRRADIFPPRDQAITARDRVAICSFFKKHLDLDLEREDDAIADAVFQSFPKRRDALREVERALDRLPGRPELPEVLQVLGKAIEDCCRSRQVEEIVVATKRNLDLLSDGMEQLGIYAGELNEAVTRVVRDAAEVREHHLEQLANAGAIGEAGAAAQRLIQLLRAERPWRATPTLAAAAERVRQRYQEVRRSILSAQGVQAESAAERVKARPGFERLSADEAHRVLRPFTECYTKGRGSTSAFSTAAEAPAPSLVELRDHFVVQLAEAEERANDLLDELLSRGEPTGHTGNAPVVKLEARVYGREIETKAQLDALLQELGDRVAAELKNGARVRLV